MVKVVEMRERRERERESERVCVSEREGQADRP
jgi:hypothetical protein